MQRKSSNFEHGTPSKSAALSGHEFDLAQLEFAKRQLQQSELRQNKKLFANKVRRESYIRSIINKFTIRTPINVSTIDDKGIYLGMYRRSKRDPTRLFEGTSTYFQLSLQSPLRN